MSRFFKIITFLCLALFSIQSYGFCSDYQEIYNEAWKITGENFHDSTMNHQDWLYWKKHYSGKIKTQEDLNVAIGSSLASLDDIYTRYLLKTDFSEEKNDIHSNEIKSLQTKPRYFKTRIPKDIKYLRIDSMMNKNLASEVSKFITESEKDPYLKGYIIDLRDDGGGLVKNASEIASLFMNNKVVLYAKMNKKIVQNTTEKEGAITDKPVVILINDYTASSCEVFTGAMQGNKRATVVGTTSFGKGIIQKIFKLSDGSGIHVTVMSYYTPENKPINKIGIEPDMTVYFTPRDILFRRDVQLLKAINLINKK